MHKSHALRLLCDTRMVANETIYTFDKSLFPVIMIGTYIPVNDCNDPSDGGNDPVSALEYKNLIHVYHSPASAHVSDDYCL